MIQLCSPYHTSTCCHGSGAVDSQHAPDRDRDTDRDRDRDRDTDHDPDPDHDRDRDTDRSKPARATAAFTTVPEAGRGPTG